MRALLSGIACAFLVFFNPLANGLELTDRNDSDIIFFSRSNESAVRATEFTNCSQITTIAPTEQCQFVRENCMSESVINYYRLYFCDFHLLGPFAIVPVGILLVLLFLSLGVTASEYLCPNLHTISKGYLKIPDNLAGLTLLAFGNSSPDIFSTFQAIKMDSVNLAVSELIGASLFISTCVIGCIGVVKPFEVPKMLFRRDAAMYLSVYALITAALVSGYLQWAICVLLVAVYVVYVTIVILSHRAHKSRMEAILRERRARSNHGELYENGRASPIDDIYLDRIARLPTVDNIHMGEGIGDGDDYDQAEAEADIGNYGLKKLMKDLSTHSNLTGTIQLEEQDRPVREDSVENGLNLDSNLNLNSENSHWNQIYLQIIYPQLANFRQKSIKDKVSTFLQLPILIPLKLTIPVREYSNLEKIENDLQSGAPFMASSSSSIFDHDSDCKFLQAQIALGTILLVFSYCPSSTLAKTALSMVISCLAFFAMRVLYPKPHAVSFIKRLKIINCFASIFGLVTAVTWISIIASEVVSLLHVISAAYSLSDDLLGITLFAVGNSVGDFATNYTIAKMGLPNMAFAACFGGPLLALCSLGLNGLILSNDLHLQASRILWIGVIALFWNMAVLCVNLPRNGWMLDRKIGSVLIGNWIASCALCTLSNFV
ncbi:uncharacterized protein LODBEIA_P12780 [Lodderomyces beijingensis]|uniref:Sodium/calcium exchanger membrane region domain-containing protein n=1 Tax=Lodderomyces beijingensis TaxID=1775926 RepID=A0ABP0ZGR7_9ASCO